MVIVWSPIIWLDRHTKCKLWCLTYRPMWKTKKKKKRKNNDRERKKKAAGLSQYSSWSNITEMTLKIQVCILYFVKDETDCHPPHTPSYLHSFQSRLVHFLGKYKTDGLGGWMVQGSILSSCYPTLSFVSSLFKQTSWTCLLNSLAS